MESLSVWRATTRRDEWPSLGSDVLTADVVVVGGGITGITLALRLTEAGRSVVVLEAGAIGEGSTGNSTGNVYETVSGGLHELARKWDADIVSGVVASRQHAIDTIRRRIEDLEIDCAWRRCPLYRYSSSSRSGQELEEEYRASRAAGLSAQLESTLPDGLAPSSGAALVLEGQAQFQPLAYVQALARAAASKDCRIFQHSAVQRLDRDRGAVVTAHGEVAGRDIVLATHSPSGFHLVQAELLPFQEYGLAFETATHLPPGIFWDVGDEPLSFRSFETDGTRFLVAVGQAHRTGQHDAQEAIERLEAAVRRRFRFLGHARFRWSAQNFQAADRLPYIGQDLTGTHIATGFATDGLVFGTVAAHVIADRILDKDNPWADMFRPGRFEPTKAAQRVVQENVAVVRELVKGYIGGLDLPALSDIEPGQAALVRIGGESVAAHRDEHGVLHAVSAVCTHLKCKVQWNGFEKSWDCPCHGSRFSPDGEVICGPAIEPLAPISLLSVYAQGVHEK